MKTSTKWYFISGLFALSAVCHLIVFFLSITKVV